DIGIEIERHRLFGSRRFCRAAYAERAAGVLGEQREIGKIKADGEVCRVAGIGAVGGELHLRIGHREILGTDAVLVARKTPAELDLPGKELVGGFVVNGEIAAHTIKSEVEGAAHGLDLAFGIEHEAAGELAVGKAREGRDAVGLKADTALEGGAIDDTGKAGGQGFTDNAQLRQLDRLTALPHAGKAKTDAVAKRRLDGGIGSDAGKGTITIEGDHAIGRIIETGGHAADSEGDLTRGKAVGFEAVDFEPGRPVAAVVIAEINAEASLADARGAARNRQGDG